MINNKISHNLFRNLILILSILEVHILEMGVVLVIILELELELELEIII